MLHMRTASTLEIDDVELAVQEILDQLNLPENLLKNAVGLITCYSEFIDSGVVRALCHRLPFDVAGCTTLASASCGGYGLMPLTLTLLTSDTLSFATVLSGSLAENQRENLAAAYEKGKALLPDSPSLLIPFMPLIYNVGGDTIVSLLNEISGGVPTFGTAGVDHTTDYRETKVIVGGETSDTGMGLVLISGDIRPTFLIASISGEKVMKQKAIITSATGNVLREVNNMPILRYMEGLGLSRDGRIDGANCLPFIVDYNDGTQPVARAIYALTPEGYAVCGGDMPVDSTLSVGTIDDEDVIRTSGELVKAALDLENVQGIIAFSCLSRNLALGVEALAEMALIHDLIPREVPYSFAYSGGEICPVYDDGGSPVNRYHNDTLVLCVLQ